MVFVSTQGCKGPEEKEQVDEIAKEAGIFFSVEIISVLPTQLKKKKR